MTPKEEIRISKFMSLVLRHEPEALGLTLDPQGWCDFPDFATRMAAKFAVTEDQLRHLIAINPKQRFILGDGRIRANQGHSVEVDLALAPVTPPAVLYHGTTAAAWESIASQGVLKGERNHVHLSADTATARIVASRRKGPWVILSVDCKAMSAENFAFFQAENRVWLTDHVPPRFLSLMDEWS